MAFTEDGYVCNNEMRHFELCTWEDIIVFFIKKTMHDEIKCGLNQIK